MVKKSFSARYWDFRDYDFFLFFMSFIFTCTGLAYFIGDISYLSDVITLFFLIGILVVSGISYFVYKFILFIFIIFIRGLIRIFKEGAR